MSLAMSAGARDTTARPWKSSSDRNVKGGRCEACQGDGLIKIEMHFLPDVYVTCDVCRGKRYNRETLEILFRSERQGRPLRSLPGRRPDQDRDALPARRLCHLRCLPGQEIQPRDPGNPLPIGTSRAAVAKPARATA